MTIRELARRHHLAWATIMGLVRAWSAPQRKEGAVLVTKNPCPSLWESVRPECCRDLPAEMARVDDLLDDMVFIEPYRAHSDPELGRRSWCETLTS